MELGSVTLKRIGFFCFPIKHSTHTGHLADTGQRQPKKTIEGDPASLVSRLSSWPGCPNHTVIAAAAQVPPGFVFMAARAPWIAMEPR